jgi:hypothetical protein
MFQVGGSLVPTSMAFDSEVYSETNRHLSLYKPEVIASPKLSGKTTFVNMMKDTRQKQIPQLIEVYSCEIPEKPGGVDSSLFLNLISESVGCTTAPDLESLLRSMGYPNGKYRFLLLKDTHNLEESVLRWLLRSVTDINESIGSGIAFGIKIIIDGSHSIETMTAGPDSEFPLPQRYPGEFSARTQRQFVKQRLSKIGVSVTEKAYRLLWEETAGDKYLTQAICIGLIADCHEAVVHPKIGVEAIRETIRLFVDSSGSENDPLKTSILSAYPRLVRYFNEELIVFGIKEGLEEIGRYWHYLLPRTKDLAYRSGIVRKVADKSVEFRAPLVKKIIQRAHNRIADANTVIESFFDLEGVLEKERNDAAGMLQKIIDCAADGSLLNLHVGFVKKINEDELSVTANALYLGNYEAIWKWKLRDVEIGCELYMIKYARENGDRMRETDVKLFQIKDLNSIDYEALLI